MELVQCLTPLDFGPQSGLARRLPVVQLLTTIAADMAASRINCDLFVNLRSLAGGQTPTEGPDLS